jgi:hypothetical protein
MTATDATVETTALTWRAKAYQNILDEFLEEWRP